jgi:hypothetical protein
MTKYILKILICIFIFSCKPSHEIVFRKQMKESFIYDFKITYFQKLLLVGYNNSKEISTIVRNDQSGFGEIILSVDDFRILDSIVNAHNKIMIVDSINGKMRAEGTQGKRVLGFALNNYNSKWLDSLAKSRCKIFIKDYY